MNSEISCMYALAAIASVTLVLALMDMAAESWAYPLDLWVSGFFVDHRTADETLFMRGASWLGGPYGILLVVAATVCSLAFGPRPMLAAWFGGIVLGSLIYALLLKRLIGRKRPAVNVLETERTYSFPSAHTMLSTVTYVMLGMLSVSVAGTSPQWIAIAVTLFILAVGASRIYLGSHYLSDVIGGILGGAAWASLLLLVIR